MTGPMSTNPPTVDTDIRDLTIIGGGPVGLIASFWAGMREASARIVDSLPDIGGQLTALYPEKWIFDVPGFPRVLAKDLVETLARQSIEQFDVPVHLGTTVQTLEYVDDVDESQVLCLSTDQGPLYSRAVLICGGHGTFEPKRLPGYDLTEWEGRGAHYLISEKASLAGKRVVIVGGGDSACDWVLNLLDTASELTLVHRRDGFRAHEATVREITDQKEAGNLDVLTPYEIDEVQGNGWIEQVTFRHLNDSTAVTRDCDALVLQLGFKTHLGPLKDWPLEIERGAICVDATMHTTMPGVFACGDVTTYEGKLKLIATGFSEAAVAVAQAVRHIRPDTKLQPKYSTNTGVPGVTEGQV
jgi:ferredoxin/flavodoxin---NADP+ reductase